MVLTEPGGESWKSIAVPPPARPKIYHIVHVNRIPPIIRDGGLMSYAGIRARGEEGTSIGMRHIKERRLTLTLESQPGLLVGSCVPFYFCSRSVMLYMINVRNDGLEWRGGQEMIVHLQADLHATVAWARSEGRRWAFTLSNAASGYFEDRCDLAQLGELNWDAINARMWMDCRSEKQAEFLVEEFFPWTLVEHVGVPSAELGRTVLQAYEKGGHRPAVTIERGWYY